MKMKVQKMIKMNNFLMIINNFYIINNKDLVNLNKHLVNKINIKLNQNQILVNVLSKLILELDNLNALIGEIKMELTTILLSKNKESAEVVIQLPHYLL